MKTTKSYIRSAGTVLLCLFVLAITPWGIFHHHAEPSYVKEAHCTHEVHVETQKENCLICKAHLEKHFVLPPQLIASSLPVMEAPLRVSISSSYSIRAIYLSLRAPPEELFSLYKAAV